MALDRWPDDAPNVGQRITGFLGELASDFGRAFGDALDIQIGGGAEAPAPPPQQQPSSTVLLVGGAALIGCLLARR